MDIGRTASGAGQARALTHCRLDARWPPSILASGYKEDPAVEGVGAMNGGEACYLL